jgi:stearoyl-CoA desaturase (delta-9 desaturase)
VITLGEGWHNNHHQFMGSARQGLRWWEIDMSYYVLWFLSLLGIVRDLRTPSAAAVSAFKPQSPLPRREFPTNLADG